MSAITAAVAHFDALPRKRVEVPEWGPEGQPFVVYATAMTVGEREEIRQIGNTGSPEMLVDVLIRKAVDENGERLFMPKDRHDLTHRVDSRVVSRIALEILDGPSDEDLEKN